MGDKEWASDAFQKGAKIILPFGDGKVKVRCYHWLGKAQYNLGDLNRALESSQKAT